MRNLKKYITKSNASCAETLGYVSIMENPVPFCYYSTNKHSKRCYGWPVRECHDIILQCLMGPPVHVAVLVEPDYQDRPFELLLTTDAFHVGYSESFSYDELMYEIAHNFPNVRCRI